MLLYFSMQRTFIQHVFTYMSKSFLSNSHIHTVTYIHIQSHTSRETLSFSWCVNQEKLRAKDTLACRLEELEIGPPTFRLVDVLNKWWKKCTFLNDGKRVDVQIVLSGRFIISKIRNHHQTHTHKTTPSVKPPVDHSQLMPSPQAGWRLWC